MSFLSPLALLLSTLSVPLLLLYFLKVRRRQMAVSSLLLWDSALRDREASTFFQRLQRDPLLLLQILALLALTVALARPAVTVMGHGAKRVAIVLDSSASMKATDVSPSRFVQAQREALAVLGRFGEGAEVMVIEAGVQPRVVAPFTRKHEQVASAIRSLQAHDLPNRLGEAIRTARALVGQDPARGDPRVHRRRPPGRHPGPGRRRPGALGGRGPALEQRGDHQPGRSPKLLRHVQLAGLPVGGELLRRAPDVLAHPHARRRDAGREDADARPRGAAGGGGALHRPWRRRRAGATQCLRRPRSRQRRLRGHPARAIHLRPPGEPGQPLPGEGAARPIHRSRSRCASPTPTRAAWKASTWWCWTA